MGSFGALLAEKKGSLLTPIALFPVISTHRPPRQLHCFVADQSLVLISNHGVKQTQDQVSVLLFAGILLLPHIQKHTHMQSCKVSSATTKIGWMYTTLPKVLGHLPSQRHEPLCQPTHCRDESFNSSGKNFRQIQEECIYWNI